MGKLVSNVVTSTVGIYEPRLTMYKSQLGKSV